MFFNSSSKSSIDELIWYYKQNETIFQDTINCCSHNELKNLRCAIAKQIRRLSASIKKGLKSKDCVDQYTQLTTLKKIRAKIKIRLDMESSD